MNTRKVRQVLAMVLAVIMLVAGLPMAVSAKEYKVGDIIQFGSYPQTNVTDRNLIAQLEAAGGEWVSFGYISGPDKKTDYMKYKDVTVGNERYRAVKFTYYRPKSDQCLCNTSISYTFQESNRYYINTTYWFKFEPLKWRVLDPKTGLVLSENIIDSQPYSNHLYYYWDDSDGDETIDLCWKDEEHTVYANNYAESSIRTWLNADFYNTAFSGIEKECINITTIENKSYSQYHPEYDSETTNDKIFLLSVEDANNTDYGFSGCPDFSMDIKLRATGSDYAKCQGLYNGVSDFVFKNSFYTEGGKSYCWWLRTSSFKSEEAIYVVSAGYTASQHVNITNFGVRPAFCFVNGIIDKENIYNMKDETYYFKNYSDEDSKGGHCFGMSMTSSAYYLGLLDYPYPVEKTYLLYEDNPLVKEPICYYQEIQGSYIDNSIVAGGREREETDDFNISSDWNEVLNYVKNHDYDGKGNLVIGYQCVDSYLDKEDKNYKVGIFGHAVNFLRYEEVNGEERIYVYDNNFPDDETYFYKDSEGKIQQEPEKTFERPVISIFLLSAPIYFSIVGNYDKSRFIYTNKDSMEVEGVAPFTMFADSTSCQQVLFELPDDITEVTIKPLKDNAEFRYMDQVYTFSEIDENTVGILKLAESDDEEGMETVEFNIVENEPEVPHTHSYDTEVVVKEATCIEEGTKELICSCGEKISETVNAKGHTDTNDDGYCDSCKEELRPHTPSDPTTPDTPTKCTCKCHSSGFTLFIWKIGNFFHRIFHMDKYRACPCGKKMHW